MRGIRAKQLRHIAYGRDMSAKSTKYRWRVLKMFINAKGEKVAVRGMVLCSPERKAYKDAKREYMKGNLNIMRNKAQCLKELHG